MIKPKLCPTYARTNYSMVTGYHGFVGTKNLKHTVWQIHMFAIKNKFVPRLLEVNLALQMRTHLWGFQGIRLNELRR